MYSTCIFCHAGLGANQSIENFPIGRRLAFDAARGRLWVVCQKCERWNLTPIEERWEAIEECERLFRATRLRVSTDQIGLARLREGLALIRIGAPQRPEMAAWRYGDQFGRRRKRYLVYTGAFMAIGAAAVTFGPLYGGSAGSFAAIAWQVASSTRLRGRARRVRIPLSFNGTVAQVHPDQAQRASVLPHETGWALRLRYFEEQYWALGLLGRRSLNFTTPSPSEKSVVLVGRVAERAAAALFPAINVTGARRKDVDSAIGLIEDSEGDRNALLERWVEPPASANRGIQIDVRPERAIASLPAPVRLALEMMTHEHTERQALDGELSILETMWREAEEIAGIADRL